MSLDGYGQLCGPAVAARVVEFQLDSVEAKREPEVVPELFIERNGGHGIHSVVEVEGSAHSGIKTRGKFEVKSACFLRRAVFKGLIESPHGFVGEEAEGAAVEKLLGAEVLAHAKSYHGRSVLSEQGLREAQAEYC